MNQKSIFIACLLSSIVLMVVGFFMPPQGQIDGSVLTATGVLFAFASLAQIPQAIQRGKRFKLTHGNSTVLVEDDDDNDPC